MRGPDIDLTMASRLGAGRLCTFTHMWGDGSPQLKGNGIIKYTLLNLFRFTAQQRRLELWFCDGHDN